MKIIVLMGSPNRNGSTGILVDNFILIMLWKSSGEYSPLRRIVYVIS